MFMEITLEKERIDNTLKGTYREVTDIGAAIVKSSLRQRTHLYPEQLEEIKMMKLRIIEEATPILKKISQQDELGVLNIPSFPEIGPTHYELEHSRRLGASEKPEFQYPEIVINEYKKYVTKQIIEKNIKERVKDEAKLTITKRKQAGSPVLFSGSDNEFNTIVQYLTALVVTTSTELKIPFSNLQKMIERGVGYRLFMAYGERFQATAKRLPYFFMGKYQYDVNFVFDRARRINMQPKLQIFKQRKYIKVAQFVVMNLTIHDPQPGNQSNIILNKIKDDAYAVFPFDFKNYEYFAAGKGKLIQIRQMIAWMISEMGYDGQEWYEINLLEQSTRNLMPFHDKIIESTAYESLPSGEGTTTTHNMVANDLSMFYFIYQLQNLNILPKDKSIGDLFGENSAIYDVSHGDDTILFTLKKYLDDTEENRELIKSLFKYQDYEIDFEPNIKFLGQNYDIYRGPNAFRLFEKCISPERTKHPDLANLGFALRLELVPQHYKKEFLKDLVPLAIKILQDGWKLRLKLNPYNTYQKGELIPDKKDYIYDENEFLNENSRLKIIRKGIDTANKIAEGTMFLDDLVQSLTHQVGAGLATTPLIDELFGFSEKSYTVDELHSEILMDKELFKRMETRIIMNRNSPTDVGLAAVNKIKKLFSPGKLALETQFTLALDSLIQLSKWYHHRQILKGTSMAHDN